MIYLAPCKIAFPNARRLKEAMNNCRIIKLNNSNYDWESNNTVINLGRSNIPYTDNVVNKPTSVILSANKVHCLNIWRQRELPCPKVLTNEECIDLLKRGKRILVRENHTFGGRGIDLIDDVDDFRYIPLGKFAVRFYPKDKEYRVHVSNGRVISVTEKRATSGTKKEGMARYIRSYSNGWIHCRQNVGTCPEMEKLAIDAVSCIPGLTFAAVDIMKSKAGNYRLLEINTAPSMFGSVLEAYVKEFERISLV